MSEEMATTADQGGVMVGDDRARAAKDSATMVYALQAASLVLGITFIVAVVVNYIKKDAVAGTWVESHFRWQIRTFWFSLLWTVLGFLTAMILVGYFIILADVVWVIYRIVKGWVRLSDGKPMYSDA